MADVFNAKKARTKHAMPMWVDSFLRKTMTLSVDQIGAYNLILFAMWSRESCDLPDDDAQIAAVCRVSKTVWLRKFKPVMWPFFEVSGGAIISDRLQKEALFVEKYLQSQSDKKRGKKKPNPRKTNEPPKSGDQTADKSGEDPTQQPNNPTIEESKASSIPEVDFYQEYLSVHPNPVESVEGERAFSILLECDVDPKQIIASASAYAEKSKSFSSKSFIQQSDNFLDPKWGKWKANIPAPKAVEATDDQMIDYWSEKLNSGEFVAASSITPSLARAILGSGKVSPEKMKERGIAA